MESNPLPVYYVVLIGIDAYPPGYNSLSGCVNDIDAIEALLTDETGLGLPPRAMPSPSATPAEGIVLRSGVQEAMGLLPPEQVRITRLAASRPDAVSASRLLAQTLPPTKANVAAALQALAGPTVQPTDRVLIYYSGHGDQVQLGAGGVWHEAIVPHNGARIQYLYDVELNPLIDAITARTSDVTVILDSCHSAGATKALIAGRPGGAARLLQAPPGKPPDVAPVDPLLAGPGAVNGPARMLQAVDPAYFALAACQAEESAREGNYDGAGPHGNLTQSLLHLLAPLSAAQRAQLRWADLWPALLAAISASSAALRQPPQHPAWTGRAERRVFGGAWQPLDAGYPLSADAGGGLTLGAGTLLGVTEGAELAVYGPPGPPPDCFLFAELGPIGSAAELAARRGTLRVSGAARATAQAVALDASFALLPGMRSRLVKPGRSERLRVSLEPPDAALAGALNASAFLAAEGATLADAEAHVRPLPDGGWEIVNDLLERVATSPAGESFALRAGLESYARYQMVLRLAKNSQDPQLANCLSLRLLDCGDAAALAAADPADPQLPEAPRDGDRIYALASGDRFCIQLASTYADRAHPLHATVFNCGAAGEVQYLGDTALRAGDRQVLWLRAQQRSPFIAGPDFPQGATDRLIAVATTRQDANLQWLALDEPVQAVIDRFTRAKDVLGAAPGPAAPGELWTAVVTPLRIGFAPPA